MSTDEELVAQYQAGDESAFAALLERCRGMMYTIIKRLQKRLITSDRDDLYQEASMTILKAAQTYDIGRGSKFISYAWKQVEWRLLTYIQNDSLIRTPVSYIRSESISRLRRTISIDKPFNTDNESANLANTILAAPIINEVEENDSMTHYRKVLSKALAIMKPRSADIIKARLRGDTFKVIGERLGITKSGAGEIGNKAIIAIRDFATKTERKPLQNSVSLCYHTKIKRNGHDRYGNQRFRCLLCKKTWIKKLPQAPR